MARHANVLGLPVLLPATYDIPINDRTGHLQMIVRVTPTRITLFEPRHRLGKSVTLDALSKLLEEVGDEHHRNFLAKSGKKKAAKRKAAKRKGRV